MSVPSDLPQNFISFGVFVDYDSLMDLALQEAAKAMGYTKPNPMVGALVVENGQILSKGYHHKAGDAHAEVEAITPLLGRDLSQAELIVSLEPCCHHGKTPPCTDLILKSGIKKVVCAVRDPNPLVSGKGLEILRAQGVKCIEGLREKEARQLNSIFFFHQIKKRPYIVLKSALTLDGKMAAASGDSKWISCEKAREEVHQLRKRLSAIAVGRNTLEKDRPRLNCRLPRCEDVPLTRLLFSSQQVDSSCLAKNPAPIYQIDRKISASREDFLKFCSDHQIDSILVEGGGKLNRWFLDTDLADRIFLYYKPAFMGDSSYPVFPGKSAKKISELRDFTPAQPILIDQTIRLELYKGERICLPV